MKKIAIIGGGGFGREVKMLIDQINNKSAEWEFIGYYDDGIIPGTIINGYTCLGPVAAINDIDYPLYAVSAIGDPKTKEKVLNKVSNEQISFPVLIHPSAIVGGDQVSIGAGTIITAGVFITVNIVIGKHVILNLGCTVGHDSVIGDYSSFMPSVNISGEVNIHPRVYVGTGAKIINQLEIGENTIVGAGAVVSKTLPANCTAVGIPARPVKFND